MHTGTMFAQDNLDADSAVPTQDGEGTSSAKAGWRVCAIVLLLFIVAAALSAMRKDVTRGFDEVAHVSYIAHLQHTGETWPVFAEMRMLDPSSFRFTGEANYLNHPSPYYWLLARLGPGLEGHPRALLAHRLFNVALVALGLAALMAIGLAAGMPRLALYAYVVPLACIPVLAPLAGPSTTTMQHSSAAPLPRWRPFSFSPPGAGRGSWRHSAGSSSHHGRSSPDCCWRADWSRACCCGCCGAGACHCGGSRRWRSRYCWPPRPIWLS